MNSVFAMSTASSIARTCAGSVESSTCSFGKPAAWPKVSASTSGPEARSAHAEHDGIGEFLALHPLGKILVVGDVGLGGDAVEPAQPFVLVGAGPDRLVAAATACGSCRPRAIPRCSCPTALPSSAPSDSFCASMRAAERRRALLRDRAESLSAASANSFTPSLDQLRGDRIERDAGSRQLLEHARGVLDILFEAVAQLAVVAERIERRRRHGVDGVGPISSST